MVFNCAGKTYQASDLRAYETGNPALPTIYVAPFFESVFVVTVDGYRGVMIRKADAVEIKSLSARYGIDDLLRALPLRDVHLPPKRTG